MNHQLYVIMRDNRPVAVEFEFLGAQSRVPGHELASTNIRAFGHRMWVVEYAGSVPSDAEWTIHRIDVAPYLDSVEAGDATGEAYDRGYQAARHDQEYGSGMP